MLQAFVSLKPQHPPRTESGMRSFFEALTGAVFSQPTIFRTNADATVRPYSLSAICEATLNPRCKFVVLRAEGEKFWQCTFLLPDKQGLGALFFDLQRTNAPRRIATASLIEMFRKLYQSLKPRLIRIGDSEAREKLKSRHGLVMMPGLGRIEWLQIVSPEVYSPIYNPSELVAAPAFATEILDDGALFLRVYDDPNEWDFEDNISLANFIPGFLAGVAKIQDSEKEKEALRDLERLWSRAEKTAEKAYEVLDADIPAASTTDVAEAEAETQAMAQKASASVKPSSSPLETQPVGNRDLDDLLERSHAIGPEDARMRSVIFARLKSEYKVDEEAIRKRGIEGPCTIFEVKPSNKPAFFASYQDLDRKVFILNVLEDLARFIAANDAGLNPVSLQKITHLIRTYYRPEYTLLASLNELPQNVIRDRRVSELRQKFEPAAIKNVGDNRTLTFWFYQSEHQSIETLTLTQFEDWPLQIEAKVQCTDMENAVEAPPVTQEVKPSAPLPCAAKAAPSAPPALPTPAVPAKASSSGGAAKIVVGTLLGLVVIYVLLALFSYGGDFTFILDLLKK